MSTAQVVGWGLAGLTAAGGLSWVVAAFTVRASKKKILAEAGKTDADAAEVIRKSATALVADMQEDAKEARADAKQAREESRAARLEVSRTEAKVAELSHQLDEAISEGRQALAELRTLKAAILDPQATLGSLRDLVTKSSRNGTP